MREQQPIRTTQQAVLLRSVASSIRATGMLYIAASMLTPGRNAEQRIVNRTVCDMVARLLELPVNAEVVEYTLRHLPHEPTGDN